MDTIQHGAHGLLIAAAIDAAAGYTVPTGIYLAGALGGIAADVAGEAERVFKSNDTLWNWYKVCHTWEAMLWAAAGMFFFSAGASTGMTIFNATLAFAAAYALHLWIDRHTHKSMGAKRDWFPPAEMWQKDFWGAVRYCWPNWLGWAVTVAVAWVIP